MAIKQMLDIGAGNLRELLQSSYHNVRKLVPNVAEELDHVRYNFDAGRYERDGSPVESGYFKERAREASEELRRKGLSGLIAGAGNKLSGSGERSVIGSSTLERAVITASITRAAGEGTWREVLARLGEHLSGNRVDPNCHGLLYSKQQKQPALAGFSLPEETKAQAAQRKVQDNMNRWQQALNQVREQYGTATKATQIRNSDECLNFRRTSSIRTLTIRFAHQLPYQNDMPISKQYVRIVAAAIYPVRASRA